MVSIFTCLQSHSMVQKNFVIKSKYSSERIRFEATVTCSKMNFGKSLNWHLGMVTLVAQQRNYWNCPNLQRYLQHFLTTQKNSLVNSLRKIFIYLPTTHLTHFCTKNISSQVRHSLPNNHANSFLSLKDKTKFELQFSVAYHFMCPGCNKAYVGKTNCCLGDSEINKHINSCEQFQFYKSILICLLILQ